MTTTSREDLYRLTIIRDNIQRLTPLPTKIPILDASVDVADAENDPWLQQDHISGLKTLKSSVCKDLFALEEFLGNPASANLPPLSTNAPYLISVWNQLLLAPQPVISIFKTVHAGLDKASGLRSEKSKSTGVKVDIVAANGKQWFRINTIKNSRFLAELREIDSYMTDSSEEDDDINARPSLAQTEFDNSVLRMGRDLLRAAEANPIEGTSEIPDITIRLTRLTPTSETNNDPRIAQTITILRDMGINVELGEQEAVDVPPSVNEPPFDSSTPYVPALNVNLDLSILIALVSDLTHAPLPKNVEEAHTRFIPPKRYREWKKQRIQQSSKKHRDPTEPAWEDDEQGTTNVGKHSRALTNQVLQEMGKGLIQDIRDRLSALSPDLDGIVFWTTPEARDRALRIVSKIGGPGELSRIQAMFPTDGMESAANDQGQYWTESRYQQNFIPLLPIRILPDDSPGPTTTYPEEPPNLLPSFFRSLDITCQGILKEELTPHPRAFSEDGTESVEIQRAMVTKANPRLTAHTVQSMLWGARLGWTTLTANKSSVRAILKEIRSSKLAGRLDGIENIEIPDRIAALWLCDPKSLGEQMRSDSDE